MSYQSIVLAEPNLVGFWTLNELSGQFNDLGPHGMNANPNGTITRGVATGYPGLGSGVTFGGTTADFINVPNAIAGPLNLNAFTYECWINQHSLSPGVSQVLMSKGQQDASNGGWQEYLTTTSPPTLSCDRCNLSAGFRTGTAPTNDNNWHYIAIGQDGAGNWQVWLDGLTFTAVVSVGAQATNRDFTFSGDMNTSNANELPFKGSMVCPAVYNSLLTTAQANAHRNAAGTAAPVLPTGMLPVSVSPALRGH